MDIEDQIPPPLPCLPAGRLYNREELPLFGRRPIGPLARRAKRGDLPARSRFGEGGGEIFRTICLFNYGLLSNLNKPVDSMVSTPTYFSTNVKPDGTVSTGFGETLRLLPKEVRIKRRSDGYISSEDWEMLAGEWSLSIVYPLFALVITNFSEMKNIWRCLVSFNKDLFRRSNIRKKIRPYRKA